MNRVLVPATLVPAMLVAAVLLAITTLSFFVYPGRTYLQQDTQIYVPILEHQWSGALADDLLVEHPHVNFTFYDEITNALRWMFRLPLETVLEGEQFVFRFAGLIGIYLAALALGLDLKSGLVVAALWALGASIKGPEVLTMEYEPSPRSFAVPLLLLALGLALQRRYWFGGIAGAGAFLIHAPTTWPFWLACAILAVFRHPALKMFVPLAAAFAALVLVGYSQSVAEPQHFIDRIPESLEQLQRMRAAYNYVSTWPAIETGGYVLCAIIAAAALWRLRIRAEITLLFGGLLGIGLASIPLSWILLEREKLAATPQVQPARALLFVVGIAILAAGAAGCRAANLKHRGEAAGWFTFTLVIPALASTTKGRYWPVVLVIVAAACLLALARPVPRVALALLIALAFRFPAGLVNYTNIENKDLADLANWAARRPSATYAFPDAGHDRYPGWFRARSLRPVFVDWKGGGQVNYLPDFAAEWWRRWQATMTRPLALADYGRFGIRYVVVRHPLPAAAVYQNQSFHVYEIP